MSERAAPRTLKGLNLGTPTTTPATPTADQPPQQPAPPPERANPDDAPAEKVAAREETPSRPKRTSAKKSTASKRAKPAATDDTTTRTTVTVRPSDVEVIDRLQSRYARSRLAIVAALHGLHGDRVAADRDTSDPLAKLLADKPVTRSGGDEDANTPLQIVGPQAEWAPVVDAAKAADLSTSAYVRRLVDLQVTSEES